MEGCVAGAGICLDVDKIYDALMNGSILKPGSSCLSHEARVIAQHMVDGAVCSVTAQELRDSCAECEEWGATHAALVDDVKKTIHNLELSMKSQSWALVHGGLHELKRLV
jgi:hypothetical protein